MTPTPSSPFIPAAAWPGNVQTNSYVPVLLRVTFSVADLPDCSNGVVLPTHEFAFAVALGFVQISNVCAIFPALLTEKVTVPAETSEVFDSLNPSSDGFPAVTTIVVTFAGAAATCPADAEPIPKSATIRPAARHNPSPETENVKRQRSEKPHARPSASLSASGR